MLLLVALVVLVSARSAAAAANAKIASYRELPYGACRFAQDQFGFTPDPWQEETLVAFANPQIQRIALLACAGPGKTAIEAVCGWYFLATQASLEVDGYHHPKGICTSVTRENLRDNLWAEYAKWQARSEYLRTAFEWSERRIQARDHPATWFLTARTWPKSGSADEQGSTFSGLHGRNVLGQVDESGTVPPTVLRALEQALANTRFGKAMQGGNPISLEGMLYEAANRLADQWHVIRVTGDPDDPKAWVNSARVKKNESGGMTPAQWARKQIETYGRDNPWVMAYILGKFPPSSINQLIENDEVEEAMRRVLEPGVYSWAQKRLGVDVARFGDDRTVIFPRQGLQAFRPVVLRHKRRDPVGVDIANRVMAAKRKWGSEMEFLDATGGWAAGARDVLVSNGHAPISVQFASTNTLNPRYYNRRAEIWWEMVEWIRRGAALPRVAELVAELTTPTYTFKAGKLLVEPKDLIKERLGRSPDLADGLAVTFGLPDMPNGMERQLNSLGIGGRQGGAGGSGRALTEYDPYARI